jgi:hypothetical protein
MPVIKLPPRVLLAALVVTSSTVVVNAAATEYKQVLVVTQAPEAVEVRSLLTDEWGVPHPAGVGFFADEGSLLVAEPESQATEVLRLSPFEEALGTLRLPETSHPATLAFDRARKRLTVLSGDELITVLAADLRKAQPPVRRIPVPNLGLESPTGATFDPATGTWYVLDDGTETIVRVPMPGGSPGTPARVSLQGLDGVSLQGLAFNPADGLFYVASPTQVLLYGLDSSGAVQKTYNLNAIELGGAGLQDLRALVFAPSADPTDNPSTQHLFIADAGSTSILGGVVEVSLAESTVASPGQSTLSRRSRRHDFNPRSPDPAGITRPRGSLEICDSTR